MEQCPCGSKKNYNVCCAPYLEGKEPAPTAEALMRARYTAYATTNIDFILQTTHKSGLKKVDPESSRKWSEESKWHGLEILSTKRGTAGDLEGEVEFIARYTAQDNEEVEHHEISTFKKEDNKWFFLDGRVVGKDPYIRKESKVGRNDPCPCGSNKKFKKCCAGK